ncbi:hypothetical protein PRZ48_014921 [Zasmidium cellare]|uniref:Oxidase ustYa n=1 Tax=Zasmidium cellare TaxID=395010 RepID=A0ABR0DXP9_ZASCE|nr:hypothetical protein PRZ48_014921 [Zasmidium cellare]
MSRPDRTYMDDYPSAQTGEDEKLLYGNEDVSRGPKSSQRRISCGISALSWVANVFLLGVILYLVLDKRLDSHHRPTYELAGDINNVWPELPRQIIEFQPDDRFVGNLTSPTFIDDIKQHWIELVPKGLGFVEVADYAERPDMPRPLFEYKTPVYTTSVTHQLHCLFMIMHGFNDLALNQGSFAMDMAGEDGDEGLTREGEDPVEHLSHCFDYLRQAIMCHGDTALEGRQTTFGSDVGGSDGWNVQHVCKPWDRIHDWLEEHRIDDREWI